MKIPHSVIAGGTVIVISCTAPHLVPIIIQAAGKAPAAIAALKNALIGGMATISTYLPGAVGAPAYA